MAKMAVIINSPTSSDQVKLDELYPGNYKLNDGLWFISTNDLTKEVSIKLFGETSTVGRTHAVLSINGFWGFNETAVWEFLERG